MSKIERIPRTIPIDEYFTRIKKRIEEEKTHGIKKENITISEDGQIKKITKWEFNPFTCGYYVEWE